MRRVKAPQVSILPRQAGVNDDRRFVRREGNRTGGGGEENRAALLERTPRRVILDRDGAFNDGEDVTAAVLAETPRATQAVAVQDEPVAADEVYGIERGVGPGWIDMRISCTELTLYMVIFYYK